MMGLLLAYIIFAVVFAFMLSTALWDITEELDARVVAVMIIAWPAIFLALVLTVVVILIVAAIATAKTIYNDGATSEIGDVMDEMFHWLKTKLGVEP